MSFQEFVVTDSYVRAKSGGRRLGPLAVLWACINVAEHWRPNELARPVLRWRGLQVSFAWMPGLKFLEAVVGWRRAAVAWCRPRVIVARRPEMQRAEYLQHYYDVCHGRSTGLTDPSTWAAGLM